MDFECHPVVVEILLNFFPVQIEDIQVHDRKAAAPTLVAVCKLRVVDFEDAIEKGEVVLNLLITLDVEAARSFGDGSFEVRHWD